MRSFSRRIAVSAVSCFLVIGVANAAALVDHVQLVAGTAVALDPVPAAQAFTVTTAGSYTVTLTDLAVPSTLDSLQLDIATSSASVVTLTGSGSKTVMLSPGTYSAQVLASAAAGAFGGSFSVQVAPQAGGSAVLAFNGAVGPANTGSSPGESVLQTQVTISQAGSYQLTLTDEAFPAALSSVELIVIPHGVASPTPVFLLTGAGPPVSAVLAVGVYDLFAVAVAGGGTSAGLYSVQLVGPGGTVLASTYPVGKLPPPTTLTVASSTTLSLLLADLAFPAALTTLQSIVTQDGLALEQSSGAGTASFAADAGTAQLFVWAQADASAGQGAYAAYVTDGSQALADIAQPVLDASHYGYAFTSTFNSAASYRLDVSDFGVPTRFSSLDGLAVQRGASLGSLSNDTATLIAQSGPINIVVFPVLPAGQNGLFGVSLAMQSSGSVVYETTQGVGSSFSSQSIQIPTAGAYVVSAADLGFPAQFSTLALVVTRGPSLVGQVVGAGNFAFTAADAGTYVLNVLAQVGGSAEYGLYGLSLNPASAPTVTFAASAASISSGGQSMLSWNASNASSCSASASPASSTWTGQLATSGSQSTGALTATTTFAINCIGDGGTVSASAEVSVVAPSPKGGGGAFTGASLLCLAVMALWVLWRRRAAERFQCPPVSGIMTASCMTPRSTYPDIMGW